jgi:acyl-CoA thioesterase-1
MWRVAGSVVLLAGVVACGPTACDESRPGLPRTAGTPASSTVAPPAAAGEARPASSRVDVSEPRPRIVVLGDSLTAGYGLDAAQAYPALLQRRLDEAGFDYEVVNMGVSGDTSAGGLRRLDWALDGNVRVLIVALGGNDALRGLAPADLERNLGAIIDRARARGIDVLLCGMEAPPNLGASYTAAFRDVYRRLAQEKRVALLPFLLEGVAGVPGLNQADGIHPNEEGARRIADLVWTRLEPLLKRTTSP